MIHLKKQMSFLSVKIRLKWQLFTYSNYKKWLSYAKNGDPEWT